MAIIPLNKTGLTLQRVSPVFYSLYDTVLSDSNHFVVGCANRLHNHAVPLHRQTKNGGKNMRYNDDWYEDDEFAGTYAHDEAGYSDEDIWDIFDGEPDAYWNID